VTEAVGSIAKAVRVLRGIADVGGSIGARELAQRLGEPKSTVQRLLQTLEATGMVAQDAATQGYLLGPLALELGMACLRRVDLRREAVPVMQALRDATGETVGLNIRVGDARMYIEQIESRLQLRAKAELGAPYTLHTGSPGRVLLAFLPQAEIDRILAGATLPKAGRGPKRKADLLAMLAGIRERGHAMAFEETIAGLNTIAAPVRDHRGDVVAALSVSGPAGRFSAERMEAIRPLLLAAAEEIAARLGHRGTATRPEAAAARTRTTRRPAAPASGKETGT
jgi:IclR family acetate operon transcriptional repressor